MIALNISVDNALQLWLQAREELTKHRFGLPPLTQRQIASTIGPQSAPDIQACLEIIVVRRVRGLSHVNVNDIDFAA